MTRRELIQRAFAAAVAAVSVDKLPVLKRALAASNIPPVSPAVNEGSPLPPAALDLRNVGVVVSGPPTRVTAHEYDPKLHGSRFSFVGYDKGQPMRALEFNETERGEIEVVMERLVTEAELAGLPDAMTPEEMVYAREVLAAELARVVQRDATA